MCKETNDLDSYFVITRMKLLQCVLCLFVASLFVAVTNAITPVVQLRNGLRLIGRSDTTEANKVYYSFRGIPFAKPPVNERRFKPPVPLSGTYFGTTMYVQEDSSPCPQSPETTVLGSEDCLYINVYTPKLPSVINFIFRPVMVWVYGGGFLYGTSEYNMYGPDPYMEQGDVIVVTFNYRLGILGWLSTGDDACPGNNGLRDQILALKWVNENIRSFGGNPDLVTIFGESAGAASVGYLVQTPSTQGFYHRAMLLSGTSLCPWSLIRNPRDVALAVAKSLNINATNSEALVNELRKVPYTTLINIQTALVLNGPLLVVKSYSSLPFGPVIEPPNSEAVVTRTSYGLLANGLFQHVPYLLGFTSLEGIAQIPLFQYYTSTFGPLSLAPESMRIYDPVVLNQANAEISNHYFGPPPGDYSETNIAQYLSDDEFVRPILKTASFYSQQQPPVYLYNFSYQGYLGSGDRAYQGPGVGHAEDMVYYWKIGSVQRTPTPSDLITCKRMITLMTNFAKTGNPTPITDPVLQNTRWPRTTAAGPGNLAYLDIGNNLVPGVNPSWDTYQWWNALFAKYGNYEYDTY